MWRMVAPRTSVAMALVVTTACTDAADPVVQPDVPIFEGTIDLEIGDVTGDDPYLFTSIGSIVEDAWGRVVVADMLSSEIRVCEPDGSLAFLFGGHGEGPGELDPSLLCGVQPGWVNCGCARVPDTARSDWIPQARNSNESSGVLTPVTWA